MYSRLYVILGAGAFGAILARGNVDTKVDDVACAAQMRAPETSGNAMLQKTRILTNTKVQIIPKVSELAESAQGHSLAQTVTAKVRSSLDLLEDDGEDYDETPEEAQEGEHDDEEHDHDHDHVEEHEEAQEGHEEEDEHEEGVTRTPQDDAEHIETLKRIGRRIDTNNDDLLSAEELHQFAKVLRQKQSLEKTSAILASADSDGDGAVSLAELRSANVDVYVDRPEHQAARFAASDSNEDGLLSAEEMHAFLHPEVNGKVLQVEAAYQFSLLDENKDARLDFDEFAKMGHEDDFHYEDCVEDFKLHDEDKDHFLSALEFEKVLQGHDLLQLSIKKLTDSVDTNGDGHIHVEHEVPHQLETLLDSEFVEDYFYHQHAEHHDEL